MARKKSATKKAQEAALKRSPTTALEEKKVEEPKSAIDVQSLKKELREDDTDSSEEDSSEDEDNYGELLTEDVEEGLNKVLTAIKTGDKSLFDSNVRFFKDPSEVSKDEQPKTKSEKPIYLKDYHRMNLLDGNAFEDENGEERDWQEDGEKTYAQQQKEDKDKLLSEINNALDDEDDDQDDFLVKKEKPTKGKATEEPLNLPDPSQDGEQFLQAFLNSHAWIPKKEEEAPNMDEDDDEFDEAAEKFENAYNFRFEDPNATEIISYARSQATMRREDTNSRKRARERKNDEKKQDDNEKLELLKKKKQKKVNQVMNRLKQIREAVGDDVPEEVITKVFGDSLLNDDFDDADWDSKMAQIFDEQYYDAAGKKPEWDDDDEIMGDFNKSNGEPDDDDESSEEEVYAEKDDKEEEMEEKEKDADEPKSKRSKKKQEQISKKQEKGKLKSTAEKIVNSKSVQLLEQVEEERGRKKDREEVSFKYREVSPESFGLSTREILLAEDKDLNEFIGLKKFAPYRPKEQRTKDKRKYAKKRRLREWRMKTFNSEDGPSVEDGEEDTIKIPSIVDGGHKKRKVTRSKSKGKK